jgi:hypothetical protein
LAARLLIEAVPLLLMLARAGGDRIAVPFAAMRSVAIGTSRQLAALDQCGGNWR